MKVSSNNISIFFPRCRYIITFITLFLVLVNVYHLRCAQRSNRLLENSYCRYRHNQKKAVENSGAKKLLKTVFINIGQIKYITAKSSECAMATVSFPSILYFPQKKTKASCSPRASFSLVLPSTSPSSSSNCFSKSVSVKSTNVHNHQATVAQKMEDHS